MSTEGFMTVAPSSRTTVGYIPRIYDDFTPNNVADCIANYLAREDRRASISHIDLVSRHDKYGREYFIGFVHIENLPNRLKRAMADGNNLEIKVGDDYETAQNTILIRKYVQRAQPPATSDETITTFVPLTNSITTRPEVPTYASVAATTPPTVAAVSADTTTPTINITTTPLTELPTVRIPAAPRIQVRAMSRLVAATATDETDSQASATDLIAQTVVRNFSMSDDFTTSAASATNPDMATTPSASPTNAAAFPTTHSFPTTHTNDTRLSILEGRALIAEEHITSCERAIHGLTENQAYILKLLHATVEKNQALEKELKALKEEMAMMKMDKDAEEFHEEQHFTQEEIEALEKGIVEANLAATASALATMLATSSDPEAVAV
jgi:hypothetical protein